MHDVGILPTESRKIDATIDADDGGDDGDDDDGDDDEEGRW